MQYSSEIQSMCPIQRGELHPSAPIPVEGQMIRPKEVIAISGLSHGVGTCAPQQGAAKLTLNVKQGIIEEALMFEPTETQTVDTLDDLAETLRIIIDELQGDDVSLESYPKNLPVGRPNELIPAKHLTVNWGDFELLEITE